MAFMKTVISFQEFCGEDKSLLKGDSLEYYHHETNGFNILVIEVLWKKRPSI